MVSLCAFLVWVVVPVSCLAFLAWVVVPVSCLAFAGGFGLLVFVLGGWFVLGGFFLGFFFLVALVGVGGGRALSTSLFWVWLVGFLWSGGCICG